MNTVTQTTSSQHARLSAVLKNTDKLVKIDDAAKALRLGRTEAAKTLSRWMKQGWLVRVGSGLYAPVPLGASGSSQVLSDPWVMVPALFGSCYIGGWSAAEHWGMTEQIFKDIAVFTTQSFRSKTQEHHGTTFALKRIKPDQMFNFKTEWRDGVKVQVSDRHRTIVDMLDTPVVGGGIEHVAACFKNYLASKESDINQLVACADKLGTGVVFKRMGFLAETMGKKELADMCRKRITTGNSKLDPAIPSPRLVKRWNLWVPEGWKKSRA